MGEKLQMNGRITTDSDRFHNATFLRGGRFVVWQVMANEEPCTAIRANR